MLIRKIFRVVILLSCLGLVGCQAPHISASNNSKSWKYGDLRLIDPIDNSNPEQDVIAFYARNLDRQFQVRIDFLDLKSPVGQDIYVPIDIHPGGHKEINISPGSILQSDIDWDILIAIPSTRNIRILNDENVDIPDIEIFIERSISQDDIVITFTKYPKSIVWNRSTFQVLATPSGSLRSIDKINSVQNDAPPPPISKIQFVLWNSFNSKTPAQTLRSWDGAHSGPMRTRHGLRYLLEMANKYNISILFTDLITNENISAFDFIDRRSYVNNLIVKGIVKNTSKISNKEMFDYFVNKKENELYLINNDYANALDINTSCPVNLDYLLDIPMPTYDVSLDCKSALLKNSYSNANSHLILGGDFSKSFLGNPAYLEPFFLYIDNHPWIQIDRNHNWQNQDVPFTKKLIYDPTKQETPIFNTSNSLLTQASLQLFQDIYSDILNLKNSDLASEALRVFNSMYFNNEDKMLLLGSIYVGQIGYLIEALKWAEKPYTTANCDHDLNYDKKSECILSTQDKLLFIDPEGGYIPFLFYINKTGIHMVIGPTWEFILGISDPSEWKLDRGVLSDPNQVLGAFEDNHKKWSVYTPNVDSNSIRLTNEQGETIKSFSIRDGDVHIEINQKQQFYSIPFVLDPWERYSQSWAKNYKITKYPSNLILNYADKMSLEISSNAQFTVDSFLDTYPKIKSPEDPNFEYPNGQYLPYPMIMVKYRPPSDFSLDITLSLK